MYMEGNKRLLAINKLVNLLAKLFYTGGLSVPGTVLCQEIVNPTSLPFKSHIGVV